MCTVALVEALEWPVEDSMYLTVNTVNPSHFLGKGKVRPSYSSSSVCRWWAGGTLGEGADE
jgi:hypothetical protein